MLSTNIQLSDQPSGFHFDSNNFAMTFSTVGTTYAQMQTTSIDEWEEDDDEDSEEGKIIEVERDPDLEDGGEEETPEKGEESDDPSDDEDEFEQYLFGEEEQVEDVTYR
jgi:hypothetical protein